MPDEWTLDLKEYPIWDMRWGDIEIGEGKCHTTTNGYEYCVTPLAMWFHDLEGIHVLAQVWDYRRQNEPDQTWHYVMLFSGLTYETPPEGLTIFGRTPVRVVEEYPNNVWGQGNVPYVEASMHVRDWHMKIIEY